MCQVAGRQQLGVGGKLSDWPRHAGGQEPGQRQCREQDERTDGEAPEQPRADVLCRDVAWKADRHCPGSQCCSRGAGDPGDTIGPPRGGIDSIWGLSCSRIDVRSGLAADPGIRVETAGNDDAILVDHSHHAAGGQVMQLQGLLENRHVDADQQHTLDVPAFVEHRPGQADDPSVGEPAHRQVADSHTGSRDRLSDVAPLVGGESLHAPFL